MTQKQSREITGPIPLLVHDATTLVSEWVERNYQMQGNRLRGKHLIPPIALHEAVINALIHRKYSIVGPTKMALYENRLEIFNPGAFPSTITPENIGDGSTYLRNPLLAKLTRKLKLMEKLGSGIRTILDECKKNGLVKPEFRDDGDFVKVIFYFQTEKQSDLSLDDYILELFKQKEILKTQDILANKLVSRNSVTLAFNRLIKKKIVKRLGQGRGTYYKFIGLIFKN